MGRGRSLPSANPDNVAAGGATDVHCGGGGEEGRRRAGVGQITAHSNPYSSFSSSSFPLCVRRGFDEKFCFQQRRTGPLHYYSSRSDFRERGGREDKEEDGEEEKKYYGGKGSTFLSLPTERKNKVSWRYSYLENDSPYR